MKRMLSAITCGAWLVGCVAIGEGVAAEGETGATLYKKHKCARCHGDEGKGDGPVFAKKGKSIGDWTQPATLAEFDDAYLAEIIIKGGKALGKSAKMLKYGRKLNEEQVATLVEYVHTLASAGEEEESVIPDAPAAEGDKSAKPDPMPAAEGDKSAKPDPMPAAEGDRTPAAD